jgi:hypothetical protein
MLPILRPRGCLLALPQTVGINPPHPLLNTPYKIMSSPLLLCSISTDSFTPWGLCFLVGKFPGLSHSCTGAIGEADVLACTTFPELMSLTILETEAKYFADNGWIDELVNLKHHACSFPLLSSK